MEKTFIVERGDIPKFFQLLQQFGPVHAPVKVSDASYSFKEVQSPAQIGFEALRTILPPKKYFYPQEETILTYDKEGMHAPVPEAPRLVLFGVHPCDLAGLKILDDVFSAPPGDPNYIARRKQILIVGTSCMPDKHCFCKSMRTDEVTGGYDLFITDVSYGYYVQIATPLADFIAGADFMRPVTETDKQAYRDFWSRRDQAFTNGFEGTQLIPLLDAEWENPVWDELGERCLSCGNCTPVCPTCYCFDIVDIAQLNGEAGERHKQWDSCQFVGFAKVAGDYNFRPGPVDRLKFWYRHKLHGFDDAYQLPTCVGCGRCTVSCPAGIDDIVGTVLRLQNKPDERGKESA
jgi:sulfhydrogenase subunit beta (sulfur reductase)